MASEGKQRGACALTMGVLILCGCAKKADAPAPDSSQIVARIGSQVITTLELDSEMRAAKVPAESRGSPEFVKAVLDEMELRKYLVQQALSTKLDQEPDVLLDVMRSREQVLASVYMARQNANVSVSNEEIDHYIQENPAKFAERVVLTVDQIRFALSPNLRLFLEANKSTTSLEEIDRLLTVRDVPHIRSVGQLTQADLPQGVASAVQSSKPNSVFYGQLGASGIYFTVKSKETKPLLGAAASTVARQLLYAQRAADTLAAVKVAALAAAKYNGQYADIMISPKPSAVPDNAAAAAPSGPEASDSKPQ